jgi:alpha-tubulin suppressor-like RCC1 family protein
MAAIKTDGTLWMWGSNLQGEIGDNFPGCFLNNRSSPVQTVSGGTNWRSVNNGNNITSAIKTDGTLWLWGCNSVGQLGNNSTLNVSSPIQTISGGTDWRSVSVDCLHISATRLTEY